MGRVLPILFNGDMVRAILDGRKTVTRRAVRYRYSNTEMKMSTNKYGTRLIEIQKDIEGETHGKNPDGGTWHKLRPYIEKNPPYKKGDILYVREKWTKLYYVDPDGYTHYDQEMYFYAADGVPDIALLDPDGFVEDDQRIRWHPSIHMPKQAARIWLKVTEVRVERLHKIGADDYKAEGILPVRPEGLKGSDCDCAWKQDGCKDRPCNNREAYNDMCYQHVFINLWDSTIKPADQGLYGWQANPWVWVIEFERCGKPEPCILNGIEPASGNPPCIGYQKLKEDDEPCGICKGCKWCDGEEAESEER